MTVFTTADLLVTGNYVYPIDAHDWDDDRQALSTRAADRLNERTPDAFFPMDAVRAWAAQEREQRDMEAVQKFRAGEAAAVPTGFYYWVVE